MATTYDKASLVMIPSGVKESKLYSVKPTDGSGDFTFSRGTDTATRVNSSGLIEKERSNQLLQSETFGTTWSPTRASVTENTTTDPNGSNNADSLIEDGTASNLHYLNQSISAVSGVYTYSVYAKANTRSQIQLAAMGGTTSMARGYDLSSGTLFSESIGGVVSNNIDQSITDVGGGWYRCSMTWNATGQTNVWIVLSVANTATYSGDNTSGVYIWGAQLEEGLVATDYIETTTAAVYEGITDNLPRLDYSGGASCPSLLLEPSRTNLLEQSEYFGDSYWTKTNSIVSPNQTISPDGTLNANKYTLNATSARSTISSVVLSVGTLYTASVFVKYDSVRYFYISNAGAGAYRATFDIENGTIVSNGSSVTSSKIESYGNGWYRCSAVFTAAYTSLYFKLSPNSNSATFTNTTDFGYIWGAQVEASATYQTSYIPTYGTSASRAQDFCLTASPSTSLFNQTEGTIFTEITINAITSGLYSRILNLKNSGGSNQIYIQQDDSRLRATGFNGSNQFSSATSSGFLVVGSSYKAAFAYKDGDYAFYVNGTQIGIGTATGLGTLSVDRLDYTTGASNIALGNEVNQSLVFNSRLTNAELAALTTI